MPVNTRLFITHSRKRYTFIYTYAYLSPRFQKYLPPNVFAQPFYNCRKIMIYALCAAWLMHCTGDGPHV